MKNKTQSDTANGSRASRASRLSPAWLVLFSLSMFLPATSWLVALQMVALLVLLGHLIWMWSHD
ncbi:hypothetical protein [Pseudoxanthomonas sp.]|uniref:hypothetical protein n=1 Tax=Pseudoxanthomonas sp. TaxID=1871049 RepID=UPI003F7FCB96